MDHVACHTALPVHGCMAATAERSYLCRALCQADVSAIKERIGFVRSNGKTPDGLTLIPWSLENPDKVWQVSLLWSIYGGRISACLMCPARRQVEPLSLLWKLDSSYANVTIPNGYVSQSIACKTLCSVNLSRIQYISGLGRRPTLVSDDKRESVFLFQRPSMTVRCQCCWFQRQLSGSGWFRLWWPFQGGEVRHASISLPLWID
jgi:hypothetical protein